MGREGERAGAGSDLEGCESRGSSLARVEELAVGGYVEIRRPGFAVEAEGQRIDRLFFVEPPFAGIVIESDEGAVELVQEVDGPAVRVKSEMPRPGLFLDLRGRWIICRELACRGIETFTQLAAYSVDGSIHMQCMDWRHMGEMLAAGHAVYAELKNLIVWNKSAAGMGTFYRSKHELIFAWKHGTAPHINTFEIGQHGRHRSNVWDYAGVNTFGAARNDELAMHPTVKPVAMIM